MIKEEEVRLVFVRAGQMAAWRWEGSEDDAEDEDGDAGNET
jgi:hypothetical protein